VTQSKPSILIVEDDEAIAAGLALNLKLEGYVPLVATDGHEGLERIRAERPNLILLDMGLPKKDGFTLLSELREGGNRTPVIILSARDGEYDKVAALRLGADDYVTKPFALAELVARIDAVLRRAHAPTHENATFGNNRIDFATREVTHAGEQVKLTHLEFELLAFFVRHPKQVLSRRQLLREVWGTSGSHRTVDNFIGQLRSKLEDDPDNPAHLITVRGSGYRFDP